MDIEGFVRKRIDDYTYEDLTALLASRIREYKDLSEENSCKMAEAVIDEKEAMTTAKKIQSGKMDLEDFLSQLKQIRKLGLNNISIDPKEFAKLEAIISSMTLKERKNPDIIKASRKQRIANGSGTSVQEVNKLLNHFEQMKKMMKMMGAQS